MLTSHSCRCALSPAIGRRILMLMVLLAALVARLFHLTTQSLWGDEGFTAYLVTLPLDQLLKGLAADRHPPLYFLLLQCWTMLVGHSEFALRSFSVGVSVLTVAATYRLARQLFDPVVGVASAALLAISPIHIWYAQEARMYALLGFLTVLSIEFTRNLLQRPARRVWVVHWLVATAMLYTIYIAVFILLFESLVVLLAAARCRRWRFLRRWVAVQGLVGLVFLPWAPVIAQQAGYRATWVKRPDLLSLGGTILRVLFGARESYLVPTYLGLVGICLMLFGVGGLFYLRRYRGQWTSVGFVILWLMVPVSLIAGVSQVYPIYENKQFLMLLPAALILVALALRGQGKRIRTLTLCLLVGLWSLPLEDQYFTPLKQDWRGVASYIDAHATAGDVIYVNPSGGTLALHYYLRTPLPEDAYPSLFTAEKGGYVGEIATVTGVEVRLAPLARRHRRLWLLQVTPEFWDPHGYIVAWLNNRCTLEKMPTFYAVDVRLYNISSYGQ